MRDSVCEALCARAPSPPQRAQCVSRLPALRGHRRSRLGLDTREHAATMRRPEPQPIDGSTPTSVVQLSGLAQASGRQELAQGLGSGAPSTHALALALAQPQALPLPLTL